MLLYTQTSAKVSTFGMLSKNFNLTNGTRQGCPLSPIIFSLVIEPLAETIRSNKNISGIKIGNRLHKIGLSYYKVNNSKSFALTMNITNNMSTILKEKYNYNWDAPSFTYLGINLTFPTKKLFAANFPTLLDLISNNFQNIQKHNYPG